MPTNTTDIIQAAQLQDIETALVSLYELELSSTEKIFFHSGFNSGDDTQNLNVDPKQYAGTVQFKAIDYDAQNLNFNTYIPIPSQIEGRSVSRDGPSNRPILTVANILDTFRDELGGYSNEELIGKKITIRTTLVKFLIDDGNTLGAEDVLGNGTAPVEFPRQSFIIDRIAELNPAVVRFELATPLDLPNIRVPNRTIVGKYCSWKYQGQSDPVTPKGACSWKQNHTNPFFEQSKRHMYTLKDEPLFKKDSFEEYFAAPWDYGTRGPTAPNTPVPALGGAAWSSSQDYEVNAVVTYTDSVGDTLYYMALVDVPAGIEPTTRQAEFYWITVRLWTLWNDESTFTHVSSDPFKSDYVLYPGANIPGVANINSRFQNPDVNNGIPTVWRCTKSHSSQGTSIIPKDRSDYWERAELCGKTLNSCKLRYQANKINGTRFSYGAITSFSSFRNNVAIPFGGFPGTVKFR